MASPQKNKPEWKKVGPCLYRYGTTYYGLLKRKGKQFRKSLETQDRALANRRLKEYIRRIDGTDQNVAGRTLRHHAEIFAPIMSGGERTLVGKRLALSRLVDDWPPASPVVLSKIKPSDVALWLKPYEATPPTHSLLMQLATAFFDLAVQDKVIDESPMTGIKPAKRKAVKRHTPTLEQFRKMVADIRSQTDNRRAELSGDFVELAGTLGLGQAELRGITRGDIDMDQGVIAVYRQKTSVAFTVPIFADALPIIERRLDVMNQAPDARLVEVRDCKQALIDSCRRLGFSPHFTPRSLRRLHITRALRLGIDAPTIASWQGHSDGGALILRTYQAEVNRSHSLAKAKLMGR